MLNKKNTHPRWAAYYDTKLSADAFEGYDLVVFDRIYYPDFRKLLKKTVVLAYISAGEISDTDPEKEVLQNENSLFPIQNRWGNWAVDASSEYWQNIVLKNVDDAMRKGFDGVMLDTVDSALHGSASISPAVARKNREAIITLIDKIHSRHKGIKIMLNRGLEILPAVADQIDYALAESILTEINLSTGQSQLNHSKSYQQMMDLLHQSKNLSPKMKIYTLDYWDLSDADGVKKIYKNHRNHGFIPYVTTPDLRNFTPEAR